MKKLITKTDFSPQNFVKFSQNIREDQIEPFIYAAQENDLQPRLVPDLYADMMAAERPEPTEENPDPQPDRPELLAFIDNFVKRFLVLAAYYRFMAAHGINITQFGVSKTADPQNTFDQVTSQDRAIILRQTAADLNTSLSRMMSQPLNFDGVIYGRTARGDKGTEALRAPKRSRRLNLGGLNLYTGLIKDL